MSNLKPIERDSKVTAVRLPNALSDQLEAAVAGGRNTKSGFIRAVLEKHFGEQQEPERGRVEVVVEEEMWESMT